MPSFELLTAFFITTALFAYIPGPAMLLCCGADHGARPVCRADGGAWHPCRLLFPYRRLCGGAFGAVRAVPWLYLAVKLCGALYLIWLGFSMLRSKRR